MDTEDSQVAGASSPRVLAEEELQQAPPVVLLQEGSARYPATSAFLTVRCCSCKPAPGPARP